MGNTGLNGFLNIDGNNSGIPTSKTPIIRKKESNSRKKTEKHIGGQPDISRQNWKIQVDEIQRNIEHPCKLSRMWW